MKYWCGLRKGPCAMPAQLARTGVTAVAAKPSPNSVPATNAVILFRYPLRHLTDASKDLSRNKYRDGINAG